MKSSIEDIFPKNTDDIQENIIQKIKNDVNISLNQNFNKSLKRNNVSELSKSNGSKTFRKINNHSSTNITDGDCKFKKKINQLINYIHDYDTFKDFIKNCINREKKIIKYFELYISLLQII